MNVPTIPSNFQPSFQPENKFNPPHFPDRRPSPAKKRPLKNIGLMIFFFVFTAGLLTVSFKVMTRKSTTSTAKTTPSVAGNKIVDINQTFYFPAIDRQGKKLDEDIEYQIVSAEKSKQIILKGKRASAVTGRIFLLVNLKLKNNNNTSAFVNTREVVRLLPEMLAPDIHNDPTEIQPISSKLTRVGFAINESDTNLKLQVGTISGEKTTIDLNF